MKNCSTAEQSSLTEACTPQDVPAAIVATAIDWSIRLTFNMPEQEVRQDFEQWLKDNPLHRLAWQRIQTVNGRFNALPGEMVLETLQSVDKRRKKSLSRRHALKLLVLSGVACAGGLSLHRQGQWQYLMADVTTATGEQRRLVLEDGTELMLNTSTALSTAFDEQQRIVRLHHGEICVTTGADDRFKGKRSLGIHTPQGMISPMGTRFTVRIDREEVRVAVREGAVRLTPTASGPAGVVRAGACGILGRQGVRSAEPQPFGDDDWVDGILAGTSMRLADVLKEMNRYRRGFITCDQRIADLPVSGVLQITDTDSALRFLQHTLPIDVLYRSRYWVTVQPKALI